MNEKVYDYWLYSLPGIGRKTFQKLKENKTDSFFLYKCDENSLPDFLGKKQRESLMKGREKKEQCLLEEYEKLIQAGIKMTEYGEDDYPKKLYHIPDAPQVLFYKGKTPDFCEKSIAIVGARNCSFYGKYVAEWFAGCFAEHHVGVISGMAEGVDGFAQIQALKLGGFSVGVLGCGVNVCYPAHHRPLYENLCKYGCVLSEYLPFENPMAGYFPPRNRIISGLADALVVVEAKQKSGTLITVEMALEQGKDVFVVPGRITDELSKGCNSLLNEGAIPATSPEKVLEMLYEIKGNEKKDGDKLKMEDTIQSRILSVMEKTPMHINVLREKTGVEMEELCGLLFRMTLEDKVIQSGAGWYKKA